MSPWECFNSAICLEGWQRSLRLTGLSLGVIAALIALIIPAFIEKRISALTADRHITEIQKSLLNQLNDFKSYSAYFYAYVVSEESQIYAGELSVAFRQAGWKTHGPVLYSTDEEPPQGVSIEVIYGSNPLPDEISAFTTLQSIGVEKLMYSKILAPGDARTLTDSVTIRVGVRPKS